MTSRWRLTAALLTGWHVLPVALGLTATTVTVATLPPLVNLPTVMALDQVVSPPATIAGLLVALLAVTTGDEPSTQLLATAPRARIRLNITRVVVAAAIGVAALVMTAGAPLTAMLTVTSALVGEALAVAGVLGLRHAWVLPTLHTLAALTLGAVNRTDLAAWAWILSPQSATSGVVTSTALLLAGALMWTARLHRDL